LALIVNVKTGVEKKSSIVDVVEDKNPLSLLPLMQPVMYELKYIGFGTPVPRDLNLVCNISIALLKTGRVARVDPENPRLRRSLSGSVRILDASCDFLPRS
jgi:hypothetical protein